jgi:outer membrane protein OmpA-like peptidoglycan-associated protein
MVAYLDDAAAIKGKLFKFDNVDCEDNTTKLKATSNDAVQALADLLKKYPNAQIKLVGYANDAQAPLTNKTLSVKRAFALKDAFVKAGISYIRVDAEGRGTGINPKDTTGRKQTAMREVWVKFVQK